MAAALIAALTGAAATAYGASQSGKGMPDGKHPFEQTRAQFLGNNPNTSNYFGGTKAWTTGDGDDTRLHSEQSMSPGMESLAESLMQKAGASRGTFDSGGMPDFMQDRYAQVGYEQSLSPEERATRAQGAREGNYGAMPDDLSAYKPNLSNFDRPQYGFGGNDEAIQYGEGQGPGNESAAPQTPSGMTNLETLDYFNKEGIVSDTGLSNDDTDWLREFFGNNPSGKYLSGNRVNIDDFINANEFNDENNGRIRQYRSLVDQQGGTQGDKSQPSPENYDPAAFQALVNSLAGA